MTLNTKQAAALAAALSGKNTWIIGPPGVGKSFTIKRIVYELRALGKRVEISACTGAAAGLLEGGITLHKATRTGVESLKMHLPCFVESADTLPENLRRELQELDVLIIDEAGMLGAGQLEHLDRFLRRVRNDRVHRFGGLQVIFVGDITQLPPCDSNEGAGEKRDKIVQVESMFEYPDERYEIIALTEFVRSAEDYILQQITMGIIDPSMWVRRSAIRLLNKLTCPGRGMTHMIELAKEKGSIILAATNNVAVLYNEISQLLNSKKERVDLPPPRRLYDPAKLTPAQVAFCGGPDGVEREDKEIRDRNTFCFDPTFHIGQQVQIRRNGKDGSIDYNNGDICTIQAYDSASDVLTLLRTRDRVILHIGQAEHKTEYESDAGKIGYSAHPIIPATAITVHKAQGQTLPSVVMDPKNIDCFGKSAPNLLYVALSRVRRLSDFVLAEPVPEKPFLKAEVSKNLEEIHALPFMADYPKADPAVLERELARTDA